MKLAVYNFENLFPRKRPSISTVEKNLRDVIPTFEEIRFANNLVTPIS